MKQVFVSTETSSAEGVKPSPRTRPAGSSRPPRPPRALQLEPKAQAAQRSDAGGAALAADVGAVSADHLLHASDAGLRAMAEKGVVGVLLPATSPAAPPPPP